MSLLEDIQRMAVDDQTSLSALLRNCQILAARTGYGPLKEWVGHELNGYPKGMDVPEYRIMRGVASKGDFVSNFAQMKNAPIPVTVVPDRGELRELMSSMTLREGVGTYESMVREASGAVGAVVRSGWPDDIVQMMASSIYVGYRCIDAWHELPIAAVAGMLSQVRNKVLELALEIEQTNPNLGSEPGPAKPADRERVATVYNQTILGGQQTFAVHSSLRQTIVNAGDLDGLIARLGELGVPGEDVTKLTRALEADRSESSEPEVGRRTTKWLQSAGKKIASGTWQIAAQAGPDVVAALVKSYLGLP